MKITPVVIRNFREWIQDLVQRTGIDPAIIGLTDMSDENIRRFLQEYCSGLSYSECKDHILEVFPVLKTGRPIDEEAIAMAQQELQHYYGTPYVSEAFKEFCKRYDYQGIQDMLMNIKGSELEIFLDFIKAKYGAMDIDVRKIAELGVYGIRTHIIHYGNEQQFFNQMISYQRFRQAKSIYQLISYGENIMVAHKNINALVLIAIIDSDENIEIVARKVEEDTFLLFIINRGNEKATTLKFNKDIFTKERYAVTYISSLNDFEHDKIIQENKMRIKIAANDAAVLRIE